MTVPQEFTRLCNAVLIAEYGDDFLPIDDDRADRGNDGYLKSERRIFAAHCFKRVQNQSIDTLIRTKMVGDLGKAIALKRAEVWSIDAWTFLSNYPVPEELGAEMTRLGRESQIDVAWRGPDFFALALERHPEVAAEFPGMQVNRMSARLENIEQALSERGENDGADFSVQQTSPASDADALIRDRPPAWEYLLFAAVLKDGMDALETKWRDHELRLPGKARTRIEADEVAEFLGQAMGQLGSVIEPITRVFDGQQAAFGAPGEPGDPVRIKHFADWVIRTYEEILDWEAEIRAAQVPEEFGRAVELLARSVDQPLNQFRRFVEDIEREVGRIPAHLAKSEAERQREPLVIETTLVISVEDGVLDEALHELRRALGLDELLD